MHPHLADLSDLNPNTAWTVIVVLFCAASLLTQIVSAKRKPPLEADLAGIRAEVLSVSHAIEELKEENKDLEDRTNRELGRLRDEQTEAIRGLTVRINELDRSQAQLAGEFRGMSQNFHRLADSLDSLRTRHEQGIHQAALGLVSESLRGKKN